MGHQTDMSEFSESFSSDERLTLKLSSEKFSLQAGRGVAEIEVSLWAGREGVVDQYTVTLAGLDQSWFNPPSATVGLFPNRGETVRFTLHPPASTSDGLYPFTVHAKSRNGLVEASAPARLHVFQREQYRLDVDQPEKFGRGKASFSVVVDNQGNGELQLDLDAVDHDDACRFRFPRGRTALALPKKGTVIPLEVRSVKRRWVGPERRHEFAITSAPHGRPTEQKSAAATFVDRPLLASWAPVVRGLALIIACVVVLGLAQVSAVRTAFAETVTRAERGGCVLRDDFHAVVSAVDPCSLTTCSFDYGFADFAQSEPELVGNCASDVQYDRFGNGTQYTETGILFWQKSTNTVFYFRGENLWVDVKGESVAIYGSSTR
jgi:hypothetical protein